MTDKPRKAILTDPVVTHRKIKDERLRKLSAKMPVLYKLLSRFPQKMQDKLFTEDFTVTERIFEKAFCFTQIGKHAHEIGKILDVGCCESSLSIELASLGFKTWGIDISDYYLYHPNFIFIKGNICASPFPDRSFDLVIAMSTVEHIGLGHYKDPTDSDGDFKAVGDIYRILKPEGLFILTIPYGIKSITPVFRVYDEESLSSLIENFKILESRYTINHEDLHWTPSSKEEAARQGLDKRSRNTGNICLLLKKI